MQVLYTLSRPVAESLAEGLSDGLHDQAFPDMFIQTNLWKGQQHRAAQGKFAAPFDGPRGGY